MLDWRLKAYRHWLTMKEPDWANVHLPADRLPDDHLLLGAEVAGGAEEPRRGRSRSCSRPTRSSASRSPSATLLAGVAVDAVFDSVSVATTFKDKLADWGSSSARSREAVQEHPELVREVPRLGRSLHGQLLRHAELGRLHRRVVLLRPEGRALPDGAVDVLPDQRGEDRPVRADADHRRRRRVRELPRRLHGADARREPAARGRRRAGRARRRARSSTRPCRTGTRATRTGKGGIYNFVTKRGKCRGASSKISWTQVETGSAITWKYPSCILQGDDSVGEFYSVALTNNRQQADTGTKMIHIGKNTREHDRVEGHLRRARAEHLPRPGEDAEGRRRTRATTRSATRCSWATSAARTPSPTSR